MKNVVSLVVLILGVLVVGQRELWRVGVQGPSGVLYHLGALGPCKSVSGNSGWWVCRKAVDGGCGFREECIGDPIQYCCSCAVGLTVEGS